MKCLNAGCGRKYKESTEDKTWVNLDVTKRVKAEVYHNLNEFPYPFEDNEFDYIIMDNVLEHLEAGTIEVMEELHRITKKDGIIELVLPHWNAPAAYEDPQHKKFFSYYTFDRLSDMERTSFYTEKDFEVVGREYRFTWLGRLLPFAVKLSMYISNLVTSFRIKLRVKK